jgi:hypothetical protein
MAYEPSPDLTNITLSELFYNLYQLAKALPGDTNDAPLLQTVRQIAQQETPPRAANRRLVTENCQGWTVRVIARLVQRGIVPAAKLQMARSMMEPV